MFLPGVPAVGCPIEHAPLTDDPSGLRIGKPHMEEIGELRAGARTGQRAIDPRKPPVRRLKKRPGIADRPSG